MLPSASCARSSASACWKRIARRAVLPLRQRRLACRLPRCGFERGQRIGRRYRLQRAQCLVRRGRGVLASARGEKRMRPLDFDRDGFGVARGEHPGRYGRERGERLVRATFGTLESRLHAQVRQPRARVAGVAQYVAPMHDGAIQHPPRIREASEGGPVLGERQLARGEQVRARKGLLQGQDAGLDLRRGVLEPAPGPSRRWP